MQDKLKKLPYYRWLIFGVVASGTFMSTLTSSIVNVALPEIIVSLGSDLTTAQWVVSAYLLIITSLLPLAGRLGDICGRRIIYSVGFIGFVIGSLACGLARSIEMLIAARLVQAVGAAGLMANAPAIITSGFPLAERGKVLGMIGTVVALGTLTGPSLGGLLVESFSWHSIFFVNIPVGIIGYVGARLILPIDAGLREESIDYGGAALFTIGMSGFLLVLSHGMQWGWQAIAVRISIILSIAAFAMFIWHEKKVRHPMLDLTIFNNWPFLAGNLSGTLSFMALFANIILLPFFLHEVMALPPIKIGLVMSAFPLVMAIVAPFSGALSDRMGSLVLSTAGLSILGVGLYYTANLDAHTALWRIIAGQAGMGLGNGLFQSPNNNSVMSSVHPSKMGIAGGINALARSFGMVSGTAVAVSIFEYRRMASLHGIMTPNRAHEISSFMAGYHDALMVAACLAALGALISLNRKGHAALKADNN
jgi:EmrB/QacA subfamily drug resistance transporter